VGKFTPQKILGVTYLNLLTLFRKHNPFEKVNFFSVTIKRSSLPKRVSIFYRKKPVFIRLAPPLPQIEFFRLTTFPQNPTKFSAIS
jgi:hypothetical protein